MTSRGSDSDKVTRHGVPTAIRVNFGEIPVSAIISFSGLSVMNKKVYKKILEKSNAEISKNTRVEKFIYDMFNNRYKVIENIDINITIKEQTIMVTVLVVNNLFVDLVLGPSFMKQINPVFHFALNLLTWQNEEIINVTHFVNDRESLAAITNEGTDKKIADNIVAVFNYKINTSITNDSFKSEKGTKIDSIEWPQRKSTDDCRLTAICAKFGSVQVAGAISMVGLTVMNEKVYNKICEKCEVEIFTYLTNEEFVYDIFGEKYEVIETIVLDVTLQRQTISIFTLVVKGLFVDMVFGCSFLDQVKPVIDFESKELQWYHNKEIYVTPFVKDEQLLTTICSEGCEKNKLPEVLSFIFQYGPQKSQSSTDQAHSSKYPLDEGDEKNIETEVAKLTLEEEKPKEKPGRKKKNKKSRQRARNRAEKEKINENCTVVYVTGDTTSDQKSRQVWGYYATLWPSKPERNHVCKEKLETMSMLGHIFEAICHIFEEAILLEIDNLLIISDCEEVVRLMETPAGSEDNVFSDPERFLSREDDFTAFSVACLMTDNFSSLRYQYAAPTDKSDPLLEQVRRILKEFIGSPQ